MTCLLMTATFSKDMKMKAFKTLLEGLSEYRKTHNDDFTWVSQWIIRSKRQFPEEWYRMMKEAGCEEVEIGKMVFS